MSIEKVETHEGAVYAEFYQQKDGIIKKWLGKIFKGYSPTPDFTSSERASIDAKAKEHTKHGDVYVVIGNNEKTS